MNQEIAFHLDSAAPGFDVAGFSMRERVFAPFALQLDLVSKSRTLDLSGLIDTDCALHIAHKHDGERWFHGVVADAARGGSSFHRTRYSLTVRPALHRLGHGSDSRIWQDESVPDIVAGILARYGVSDTEWRLSESHLPREYCVQYQETHLDFVHRLLAEEGIHYFFEHGRDGHRLILSDAPLAARPAPNAASVMHMTDVPDDHTGRWVTGFAQEERVRATSFSMKDYTFKNPRYGQDHRSDAQETNGTAASYDLYDYPGRYKEPGAGKPFAQYRLESTRADATTGSGVTNTIHLSPGYRFALGGHADPGANIEHFLTSVTHAGQQPLALEEEGPEAPTTYSASFATMPARLPYRPASPNPKPRILGAQIAHVTGPAGEEIYCDEFGRVKVWFPWDRHGAKDETSSCWVRVSQNWAGAGWGHIAIPRIGHEVIVDFLEGDPDQPIVTGRTYHAANMPPHALPEHKTRMGIKSQTHKGEGFNELTFEDEADKEFIYVHAQRNMEVHVKNSRQKRVEFDDTATIGNDSFLAVARNRVEKIDKDMDLTVTENLTEKVDGDRSLTVGGSFQTKAEGDLTIKTDGEIVLDASRISLVVGGTALVVSGGSVDIVPALNVGSASPGAAAVPPIPAVLEAAAGLGTPFVTHCPLRDEQS